MNDVSFPIWADEYDQAVKALKNVTKNIKEYLTVRNASSFEQMWESVADTLNYWSGNTYVGVSKEKSVEKAFQEFFVALQELLLEFRMNARLKHEKALGEKTLYRGMIYRYLGRREPTNKPPVVPKYNDIFVSWSKLPQNSYLESKLYGTMTWLACEIKEPYWGIDLEGLGVSRGNEREVVFPTIEDCISEIKYIPEDDEDEQT